jgi:hypothetical protein
MRVCSPISGLLPELLANGCSGQWAAEHLEFDSFLDLFPGKYLHQAIAIHATDSRQALTHERLHGFLVEAETLLRSHVIPVEQARWPRRRSSRLSALSAGNSGDSQRGHEQRVFPRIGVVLPNGPDVCA